MGSSRREYWVSPFFLCQQGGAHADGELVDPHAAGLGRQEVAQLVDGDEDAENQDRAII